MMKAIMGHLKINLANDREERSKSPTRKKSSFSRWVERDLAEEQERRLTENAMRKSHRMFGSPFPQMNSDVSTQRSQPASSINPSINIAKATKKGLNSLAFNKIPDSHRLHIPKIDADALSQITEVSSVKKNTWFSQKMPKKSTQKLIQEMEDLVGKMTPLPDEEIRSRGTSYSQYRDMYRERDQVSQHDITVA